MDREKKVYPATNFPNSQDLCAEEDVSEAQKPSILPVKWAYRWSVFRRLQELNIDCQCSTNEPLLVNLDSLTTLMQVRSVLSQFSTSRKDLVNRLDVCWQAKYRQSDQ